MKKLSDYLMWLLILPVVFYILVPSSLFLKPKSMTYDGHSVTFVRSTPLGAVTADYVTEIGIVGTNQECSANGTGLYQVVVQDDQTGVIANTVQYEAPWSLWRCLDYEGTRIVHHKWVVWLFNIIPLRPVDMTLVLTVK